jgi:hypothetical protein
LRYLHALGPNKNFFGDRKSVQKPPPLREAQTHAPSTKLQTAILDKLHLSLVEKISAKIMLHKMTYMVVSLISMLLRLKAAADQCSQFDADKL